MSIDDYFSGPAQEPEHNTFIDRTRKSVSLSILSFSQSVDSFFADDRIIQEENKSHLLIAETVTFSENAKPVYNSKIRLKIRLPRTQKRLNLIVDNVVDQFRKDEIDNNIGAGASAESEEQGVTAALRYVALADRQWDINTNAGVKLKIPPDPFLSARIRRSIFLGDWETRISENVFWFASNGLGQIGRLDLDYNIRDSILFRIGNSQSWQEEESFFRFNHGFFAYQRLTDSKALSYSLFIESLSQPTLHVSRYVAALSFRRQLWRKWLFFTVTPQVSWPLDNDFSSVYALSFSIESVFQELPKFYPKN